MYVLVRMHGFKSYIAGHTPGNKQPQRKTFGQIPCYESIKNVNSFFGAGMCYFLLRDTSWPTYVSSVDMVFAVSDVSITTASQSGFTLINIMTHLTLIEKVTRFQSCNSLIQTLIN